MWVRTVHEGYGGAEAFGYDGILGGGVEGGCCVIPSFSVPLYTYMPGKLGARANEYILGRGSRALRVVRDKLR